MSRYLIDRIRMLENVEVLVHSELAELMGSRWASFTVRLYAIEGHRRLRTSRSGTLHVHRRGAEYGVAQRMSRAG